MSNDKGKGYRSILVSFAVWGDSDADAQDRLMRSLPRPESDNGPDNGIDCWWIAEDNRHDGSDNDSAVFVNMGKQAEAYKLLTEKGLV
jgi:hypothetical protein